MNDGSRREVFRPPSATESAIAKRCLLDWLGVALRGAAEPVAVSTRLAADRWAPSHGEATVLGGPVTAGMADAAMLNGVAGHALDYDDTSVTALSRHPSAPLWPALLALAELRGLSGKQMLDGFCVGVRFGSLLGARCNPAHYDAGWHATATLGTFAAAAGCGRLLALDRRQTSDAIGLAATQAAGLRAAFATPAKALQVGQAAANGLRCALLASAGAGVPGELIEAPFGFLATHDADTDAGSLPGDGLGSIRFKHHAACHSAHAAIEAALAAGAEPNARAHAPQRIEIEVAPTLAGVCDIDDPRTGREAKFSLRSVTALALDGADTADPDTFTDARLAEPGYRALQARTHVRFASELRDFQARVTVIDDAGRRVTTFADVSTEPDPEAEQRRLRTKFHRFADPIIDRDRAVTVARLVDELDELESVRPMLGLCAVTA
jgi:2-methylcitrate dehydratase PrpD